jgi:hypothetical protein
MSSAATLSNSQWMFVCIWVKILISLLYRRILQQVPASCRTKKNRMYLS